MPVSIAIVEDNAGICEELQQILAEDPGCVCVCVCRNLHTALREIPVHAPDVIIMDIRLPDGSGIDATARLKRLLPRSEIMIYTVYEESEEIFKALEAGASGYLLKETAPEELLRSIHEIRHGGVPMAGEVARKVIQAFRRRPLKSEPLTSREDEILQLLAQGFLTKEISAQLSISLTTVKSHLKHIYGKLHVRTRTEAVIKYLQ
jgi:DNA-binding NarL/FixJ family response regulator